MSAAPMFPVAEVPSAPHREMIIFSSDELPSNSRTLRCKLWKPLLGWKRRPKIRAKLPLRKAQVIDV